MKPGKTSRPSCCATSRRTGSNAAPCSWSSCARTCARGLQDLHHVGDDPRGLLRGVPGDVLAQALEATPRRTPARRRRSSSVAIAAVAASSSTASRRRVRRLHQHELGGVAELGALVLAQGGGDRQREQPARGDAHVQRLRARALQRAQPDGLALVDQRRVRADGLAGAGQRDRLRDRAEGPARLAGALELLGRARRARARSVGRAFSRSAVRSWPEATTLPFSSSTENVIFRCAGSRDRSQASGGIRTPRWASISSASAVQQRLLARLEVLEHLGGDLRDGHEPLAQVLRQARISAIDELGPEGGHEPLEAGGAAAAGSVLSGTWTVTPSCAEPGSKR